MSKASALGLEFNPAVQAQYSSPMDAKYALDELHKSWNVLCGFPKRRAIAANATIANSVVIRLQHDSSYRPENLVAPNGVISQTYAVEATVSQPPAATLTRCGAG